MNGTQSLEKQQAALSKLKNYLETFKEQLEDNLRHYRNHVEALHGDGLSNEVYTTYLNSYYVRDRNCIDDLIKHMEEADVKYLSDNLNKNEENIDVAKRSLGDF